jgi:hypothetical protein
MNPDDFENELRRRPIRPVPAEWRAEILRAANAASPAPRAPRLAPSLLSTINARLSAIFWPHPAAWAGLAGVWVVISVLNWSAADHTELAAGKPAPPAPDFILAMQEQRRTLARLIETSEPPPVEAPKPTEPRPRGELKTAVALV